jgi:hypothetical protein
MRRRTGKRTQKLGGGYTVGYGRPPKSTRFRPGQSGNPKGRPKGARSAAAMARAALDRQISVTESGARRRMTVREVAYRKLTEMVLSGDLKALAFLLSLEDQGPQPRPVEPDEARLSDQDLEILRSFLDRQESSKERKR